MRKIFTIFLLFAVCALSGQPVYRKGPTFETFISDSLYTQSYYLTNPEINSFDFKMLPSISAGIVKTTPDIRERNFNLHTQLAIASGFKSEKLKVEAYLNGGTGFYPGFQTNNLNHKNFPGFTFENSTRDSVGNISAIQFLSPGFVFEYKPDEYFTITAGYDKNFIGQGYRSVLLSDNASNYPFLKINTKIWKVNYTAMFAYLKNNQSDASQYFPSNKYAALHILDFKPWDWLDIQLYECVLWQSKDSLYNRGFDVNYLNPIVFYRPVEFSEGSADNALLGGAINIRPLKNLTLYSQVMLDEFLLKEVKAGNGWWANKFAVQGGMKVFDVAGVKGLSVLAEGNLARPYTYSHATPLINYAHNSQSLAHPLGSNFYEALAMFQYKGDKHRVSLLVTSQTKGYNSTVNEGGDLFASYNTRAKEYGNTIAQGNKVKTTILQLSYGYNLRSKIPLELTANASLYSSTGNKTMLFNLGFRTPIFNIYSDY